MVVRLRSDKLPCLLDLITNIFIGEHQYVFKKSSTYRELQRVNNMNHMKNISKGVRS